MGNIKSVQFNPLKVAYTREDAKNEIYVENINEAAFEDAKVEIYDDGTALYYKEGEDGEIIGMGWTTADEVNKNDNTPAAEKQRLEKALEDYTNLHDSGQMSDAAYTKKTTEIKKRLLEMTLADYTDLHDSGQMSDEAYNNKVSEIQAKMDELSKITDNKDGTYSIETKENEDTFIRKYDKNGNMVMETHKYADGTYTEDYNDSNGDRHITTYDENGNFKEDDHYYKDSYTKEYHGNDGSIKIDTYNSEGKKVESYTQDKNGNYSRMHISATTGQITGQTERGNINDNNNASENQTNQNSNITADATDITAAKPANNTNTPASNSKDQVQNVISGVSQAVAGITKMASTNAKYKKLIDKGYTPVSEIKTENGNVVVCNKDGKNSRVYLYDKDGKQTGSVTIDQKDIKNVEYNKDKNTITVTDSKGNKKKYSQERIDASIKLAQKYEGKSSGKYYKTDGEKVVEIAETTLGSDYVWGACSPGAYDCSGLVAYCVTGKHERIGSTETFMNWPETNDPQPGDICVSSGHTGIYIGDGQMIHAADYGIGVIVGPVQDDMKYVKYPGD